MKSDFRDLDVWKKGKELRIFFNLVKKFLEVALECGYINNAEYLLIRS